MVIETTKSRLNDYAKTVRDADPLYFDQSSELLTQLADNFPEDRNLTDLGMQIAGQAAFATSLLRGQLNQDFFDLKWTGDAHEILKLREKFGVVFQTNYDVSISEDRNVQLIDRKTKEPLSIKIPNIDGFEKGGSRSKFEQSGKEVGIDLLGNYMLLSIGQEADGRRESFLIDYDKRTILANAAHDILRKALHPC